MTRVAWRWVRPVAGAGVLGVVVWQVGAGPFVEGVGALDLMTLALGAAIALATTVACAWRWQLVARGLGVSVALGPAVASCYRAQLLNTTLPGGVLGDVHRGVRHGRQAGDTALGLRAVVWERLAGQLVFVLLAGVVLLLLPSPVRRSVPVVLGVVAAGLVGAFLLGRRVPPTGSAAPLVRMLGVVWGEVRCGLLAREAMFGVVVASTVAVLGHVATYLLAARAVGVTISPVALLPLVLLVLLAAGLPLNVAGWGPREGMAAWSFAAAGLGADQGVATAAAYGAMVLVANLPGALVLAVESAGRTRTGEPAPSLVSRTTEGVEAHG